MSPRPVFKHCLQAAKPRLVAANLISATGGFLLASRGDVSLGRLLTLLAGLSCVVASGCVFNNCIDRSIDRNMARTSQRVLATGALPLPVGLACGALLGLVGAAMLHFWTNPLTLTVVLAGFVVYVGVYSLYLKRNSALSTVIGSLAGAAPPVAGYCAVRDRFDLGALIVLAIFSLWQIPHSYAITIFRRDDYAAAAIPVMPVRHGIPATKTHIVWHTVAFIFAAQMLTAFGYAGYAYLAAATMLGLAWLLLALSGYWTADDRLWARRVYQFSILTMVLLCVMMSVDFARARGLSLLTLP